MTHATRFVVAVPAALAVGAPVQAQTPEIDALRVRAEAGIAEAQVNLGRRYETGDGVPQDAAEAVRWYWLAADQGHDAEPPRLQRCRSAALHSLPAFGRGLLGGQV